VTFRIVRCSAGALWIQKIRYDDGNSLKEMLKALL